MTGDIKQLGLIGKPLEHSFSKSYFSKKFKFLNIQDFEYELFELEKVEDLKELLASHPRLLGLNVTIPYKKQVLPFLDEVSQEARRIGAVNTIKINQGKLKGFNTDYHGFKNSLANWLPAGWKGNALVLGSGGASLAVTAALETLKIPFRSISRNSSKNVLTYQELMNSSLLNQHRLIVNTTPLGMVPNVETRPMIDYEKIGPTHFLYDLVYNPSITAFMKMGIDQGAQVKNGLEMLELQAEKAWEIWTT